MTPSDWFGRVWPSLLALFGTIAVVAVVLVLMGQGSPGQLSDEGPGDVVATATATTVPAPSEPAESASAVPEQRAPVRVLNATNVSGLAKKTSDRLKQGGWEVAGIGDFSTKESVTTAYYPEDLEAAAKALQAQFPEIAEVSPRTGQMRGDQVTLVLGSDYAETAPNAGGSDG